MESIANFLDRPIVRRLGTSLLWFGITGVFWLPALSWSGYPPLSFEYLIVALLLFCLGIVLQIVGRSQLAAGIAIAIIAPITVALYHSNAVGDNKLMQIAGVAVLLAAAACAIKYPLFALRIAGLVGLAQIAIAAALTPSPTTILLTNRDSPQPDQPSVVHLLLDEHVGIAALPDEEISEQERDSLERRYIELGFVVFRRAYTADESTPLSVARLFNPDLLIPFEALERTKRTWWKLKQASALDEIGRSRQLDVTSIYYASLAEVAARNPSIVRNVSYDHAAPYGGLAHHDMKKSERLRLMLSASGRWLWRGLRSPFAEWFLERTSPGRWLARHVFNRSGQSPLISRAVLLDLTQRLACCGTRATYTFAHLLMPHGPYAFTQNCRVRPIDEWLVHRKFIPGDPDTPESRLLRYRRHFEQAVCLSQGIADMMRAIDARTELKDATIFVHSDHGARIVIEDRKPPDAITDSDKPSERDWRGSFLAVRIPGVSARTVDTPVRLDIVFNQLLKNDFKSLDIERIPGPSGPAWPPTDSPY